MRSCEQPAAGICPGEQGSTRASSIQLLIDLSFSRLAPGIAALRLEAAGLCALTRPLSVGHELCDLCPSFKTLHLFKVCSYFVA